LPEKLAGDGRNSLVDDSVEDLVGKLLEALLESGQVCGRSTSAGTPSALRSSPAVRFFTVWVMVQAE
jgi:hypothetical protein